MGLDPERADLEPNNKREHDGGESWAVVTEERRARQSTSRYHHSEFAGPPSADPQLIEVALVRAAL